MIARFRKHAGGIAIDQAFRGLSKMGQLSRRARQAMGRVDIVRDVSYAPGAVQRLDVWRARGATGRQPALVYVHGGCFRILSKDTHWPFALRFALRGYTVFNLDYRLAPRDPYPAAAKDVCDALRWVHAHAAEYDADPGQMVVAGESAGANLTCVAAIATAWRRPEHWARAVFDDGVRLAAALPACGMLQVSDPRRFARRRRDLSGFVMDRIEETCDGYAHGEPGTLGLADPLLVLERAETPPERPLPPAMAICGTRDPILDDTRRLGRAWFEHGSPCEVRIYPGSLHAFHAFPWDPNAEPAWQAQLEFLADHARALTP